MMAQIALDAYENTTYAADPIQCHDCRKSWGWQLDEAARTQIETIVDRHVVDPVGPEFMAPPARER